MISLTQSIWPGFSESHLRYSPSPFPAPSWLRVTLSCVKRNNPQFGFPGFCVSNTGITALPPVPAAVLLELVVIVRFTKTLHITSESKL